jgi:hypothetical protein
MSWLGSKDGAPRMPNLRVGEIYDILKVTADQNSPRILTYSDLADVVRTSNSQVFCIIDIVFYRRVITFWGYVVNSGKDAYLYCRTHDGVNLMSCFIFPTTESMRLSVIEFLPNGSLAAG